MKEIALANGKGVALIDDEDYELVSRYRWYLCKDLRTSYALTWRWSPKRRISVRMHRLLMDAPAGMDVDHVDHDGLNNRRANLRLCTRAQNLANSRKGSGTSSRFKGVCWYKPSSKWMAKGSLNRKTIYLGYFDSEVEAAKAYNAFAIEHYGEHALLNEVE